MTMNGPYQVQKALLASGEYSDLVITCETKRWNVHKAIICPRSHFFAAAVRFPVGKEKEDGVIDLPEDEVSRVEHMLTFLYTSEYEMTLGTCPEGQHIHFLWNPPRTESRVGRRDMHNALAHMSFDALDGFIGRQAPCVPVTNNHPGCRVLQSYMMACHRTQPQIKAFYDAANTPHHASDNPVLYYKQDKGSMSLIMLHAKMYAMGDKYDIPDLRASAYAQLEVKVLVPVVYQPVQHLMDNTPASDKKIRDLLSVKIYQDLKLFGMRKEVKNILDKYPELGNYALVKQYDDER
ncbi:hypothetical protein P171DRAFT_500463 [Karstenula rhodostoma CBS 690.94]|uniref:BTB domain-containing protein n=1 Tax=Karstenula rhodostoma CBS 690.94 TaxID=1392251 RepID=A0A9P4U738_9PLEO|nr:hypothetical protein P171DRAFT_500463 [Karstenula rhodostoma CBS 690.94]